MDNISDTEKFITFTMAGYWFVLPMTAVLKVVNCPSSIERGVVGHGLVKLGSHTVRLLDLCKEFGYEPKATPQKPSFLAVLRNSHQELWGITLNTPPDLVELPQTSFNPISLKTHLDHKRNWVSHVAVVAKKESTRTLLLLDIKAILQTQAEQLCTR